jgi:hypothetical protein
VPAQSAQSFPTYKPAQQPLKTMFMNFYLFSEYGWYEINDVEADLIWHPTLVVENILKIEKLSIYGGGSSTKYLWIKYPHYIEYAEHIKLTISCDFDFSQYPFDSNECDMDFGDPVYEADYMQLTGMEIYFEDKYTSIDEPLPITVLVAGLPYKIDIQAKEEFKLIAPDADESYSYSGIKFTFTRNSLGLLLGGFYGPTAIFAVLSLISFVIEANAVSIYILI